MQVRRARAPSVRQRVASSARRSSPYSAREAELAPELDRLRAPRSSSFRSESTSRRFAPSIAGAGCRRRLGRRRSPPRLRAAAGRRAPPPRAELSDRGDEGAASRALGPLAVERLGSRATSRSRRCATASPARASSPCPCSRTATAARRPCSCRRWRWRSPSSSRAPTRSPTATGWRTASTAGSSSRATRRRSSARCSRRLPIPATLGAAGARDGRARLLLGALHRRAVGDPVRGMGARAFVKSTAARVRDASATGSASRRDAQRRRRVPRVPPAAVRRRQPVPARTRRRARAPRAHGRDEPALGRHAGLPLQLVQLRLPRGCGASPATGVRMVHRVDGPVGVYRGFDDGTDARIAEINASSPTRRSCSRATASTSTASSGSSCATRS